MARRVSCVSRPGATPAPVCCRISAHIFWTPCGFGLGRARTRSSSARRTVSKTTAPDHVVLTSSGSRPAIELEMTLLSWRNHFTCDILAENGSAHIRSLCKWGPSSFVHRRRILPSGRPPEEQVTLVQDDPTWQAEYKHFKRLCACRALSSLENDIWLNDEIKRLSQDALKFGAP